ncbi:glycosyl hydrolase family 38 [Tautonia marina]|uniref:glycosyl hydrolase family 38 n=1 Tax=Tautonia marina TaxID=2653855 RepID=UPI00137645ED|nr:glycosyl hydrolase family 38 [Tautonia marina]
MPERTNRAPRGAPLAHRGRSVWYDAARVPLARREPAPRPVPTEQGDPAMATDPEQSPDDPNPNPITPTTPPGEPEEGTTVESIAPTLDGEDTSASDLPPEEEQGQPLEQTEPAPPAEPEPTGPKRRVVVMIADSGRRPEDPIDEAEALIVWSAVSAAWHPNILARLDEIPIVEDVDAPGVPAPGEVRLIAGRGVGHVNYGYREQASEIGVPVLAIEAGESDRDGLARLILEALEPGADLGSTDDPTVLDFYALGSARWWVRDLTIGMEHVDCLDAASLSREVIGGARAWQSGDATGASNRLRAAFELLTESRERYYPVDSFVVDLHLLDAASPADALTDPLEARTPFTILAPAQAVAAIAEKNPDDIARLRAAIDEGWADVIGGPFAETGEGLRPVETILWQFREGASTYRQHLDDRTVETLAGRRFALYPMRPQIAKRFGFRYALHLAFDDGTFPVSRESKRLWESPEGANLESLTRPPLAADRNATALTLAWEMARSMRDDHVATLGLVHWPDQVTEWFRDLRRSALYSPVLARWATIGDYFHLTDRPYEVLRPKLDQYATPYLEQAVSKGDPSPIGRRARHLRLRARLDLVESLRSLAASLDFVGAPLPDEEGPLPAGASAITEAERLLETGMLDEAEAAIAALESQWSAEAARRVVPPTGEPEGNGSEGAEQGGALILNPLSIPRRVSVVLPDTPNPPPSEGPVRASQFTAKGTEAVVTLAGFGYAWIPRNPASSVQPAGMSETVHARGRVLRNEMLRLEIDEATGGLRSLMGANDDEPRLGQQLVIAGISQTDKKGQLRHSRMKASSVEVEYGGPALVQAVSTGQILHPIEDQPLASFRQRFRLWSGRPVLEMEIELSDLDETWLASIANGPAWSKYLASRWAWPDANATLRRSSLLGLQSTTADRPETAEVLDITARRQHTALLFGGLAHHQRHGQRMLDTLLVAGRESERTFRLGIALDLEHPFQAALDLLSPPALVPTTGGPPRSGPAGWFFHLDAKSVAVTRVEPVILDGGEGRGLAFHLLETGGRSVRCKLRLFREPVSARQTDFHDERIVELSVQGDAVQLDLTPHELARVVVTLG